MLKIIRGLSFLQSLFINYKFCLAKFSFYDIITSNCLKRKILF